MARHLVLRALESAAAFALIATFVSVSAADTTTAKTAVRSAGQTTTTKTATTTSTTKTSAATKPVAQAAPKPAPTRTSLARAATAARARTAAYNRQQAQAMTAHFKVDALGNIVPDIRAAAAIVYDPTTGDVLWEANSHDQRSIASLTKMMTAVTFMADDPDLGARAVVTRADVTNASTTHIRAGESLTYDDLLHLTLIASDNAAARVLARTSEGSTPAFVGRMNDMATALGLSNTHYEDPTGLDSRDVSSAYDLSHLIAFATADERLGPIMRTAEFQVHTSTRTFDIHTTDRLLGTDVNVDILGAKTGFIAKAGYCFATLLQVPQGSQVAVVVLGAANSAVRFWETRHLFDWAVTRVQGLVKVVPQIVVPQILPTRQP